jgi:hypothetical protein
MDMNACATVLCHCGLPSPLLPTQKAGPNQGREFYTCGQNPHVCKFFRWADAPIPAPRAAPFGARAVGAPAQVFPAAPAAAAPITRYQSIGTQTDLSTISTERVADSLQLATKLEGIVLRFEALLSRLHEDPDARASARKRARGKKEEPTQDDDAVEDS